MLAAHCTVHEKDRNCGSCGFLRLPGSCSILDWTTRTRQLAQMPLIVEHRYHSCKREQDSALLLTPKNDTNSLGFAVI